MQQEGAQVLDPHVAIPKQNETAFFKALADAHGVTPEQWHQLAGQEQDRRIYEHDMRCVQIASHFVALLNRASSGVGMELQEALRRGDLPILGLVHNESIHAISPMIRGAAEVYPLFQLKTYENAGDAQKAIQVFLREKS